MCDIDMSNMMILDRGEYEKLLHEAALLKIAARIIKDDTLSAFDQIKFLETLFDEKRLGNG